MKPNIDDPNFMQGMEDLLGMDTKSVEQLLDKLDADSLIALSDAIAKKDKETAESIVGSFEDEVNTLFRGDDIGKKEEKKKPVKPSKRHHFEIGDDVLIKNTNEDTGEDEFVSATVYKPNAPDNTIGVKVDGRPKMVDKDRVYVLKETVLGMIQVPELQRIQRLAGIHVEEPEVKIEPVEEPEEDDAVQQAMAALDELEQALPNVRLADLKIIRQRLTNLQISMNESVKHSSSRRRKL